METRFPPKVSTVMKTLVLLLSLSLAPAHAITQPLIGKSDLWPGTTVQEGSKFVGWVPDSVSVLRFIIMRHQAGFEIDHDKSCMAFAAKCAYMWTPEGENASKSEFESFLSKMATETGHPEIVNLPVMSDGETNDMPRDHLCSVFGERFLAHYGWTSKAQWKSDCPNLITFQILEEGNDKIGEGGAPYNGSGEHPQMKMMNWGWPHGYYGKKCILWPLYMEAMRLRVPADWDPLEGPPNYKDITVPQEGEWRADPSTWYGVWPEVYPRDEYPGDATKGVWLPSEDFAYLFRAKASRHPTATQHDQGEANLGATMNNADLSGQPQLMITSPARPYHVKFGGKDYPLYPLKASIDVGFKNGFYAEAEPYDAVKFGVYDGKHLLREIDAQADQVNYVVKDCRLNNTGPRSLIVIAELADGKKVTSRPVPVYVTDLRTADPQDTLRSGQEPLHFGDGILNPELIALPLGTELPSWNWKTAASVEGNYDENGTYTLYGNGHSIYQCWDRAGYAFVDSDQDFVMFGRLTSIPAEGPGSIGLAVKGNIDGISPVLDLRWDYQLNQLRWFNRHTPADMIGTHDQGQVGACESYNNGDPRPADTVCIYKQGCLGRGFENNVPGFTSREDLWLAVKRDGDEFHLYAKYGDDESWTKVDPTPMEDEHGSQAAVNLWPNFVVPPARDSTVYVGFNVVGVQQGQHFMEAKIDSITLLTSDESIAQFPDYTPDYSVGTAYRQTVASKSANAITSYANGRVIAFHPGVKSARLFSADGRCVMRISTGDSKNLVKIPASVTTGVYMIRYSGPMQGTAKLYVR